MDGSACKAAQESAVCPLQRTPRSCPQKRCILPFPPCMYSSLERHLSGIRAASERYLSGI
eukprot:15443124-Alexandrium_andersonii.AAC.1